MILSQHRLAMGCLLAFAAYAGLSLTWSSGDLWWTLGLYVSFGLSFWLGATGLAERWIWFWYLVMVVANIVSLPWLDFGFYGNANYLGCAVALGIAGALAYRLYEFIPLLAVGLYASGSRTAILASGIALFLSLRGKWLWLVFCVLPLTAIAVVFIKPDGSATLWQRLGIWQDTVNHLTLWGHGLGSYAAEYAQWPVKTNMTLQLTHHAYNDLLELIFELGLGAIFLWLALVLLLDCSAPPSLPVWTFLILGLAFFPLYVPIVGQMFWLCLGQLSRERTSYGSLASYQSALS